MGKGGGLAAIDSWEKGRLLQRYPM